VEFRLVETQEELEGRVVRTLPNGEIIVEINGKEHLVRLVKLATDEIEFLFENSFHHAKVVRSNSSETVMLLDGHTFTMKKHFKFEKFLYKTLSSAISAAENNNLTSQIPGRVVNILVNPGNSVKAGDSVIILESMKMQVAIKAHKDGTVRDIKVKKGTTVARNDVVAIIE